MSRSSLRFAGTRAYGFSGHDRMDEADALLAAGDKLAALRTYATAFGLFTKSGMGGASGAKERAANAIVQLLAELGAEAFGPDLCSHGFSKSLGCFACLAAKEAKPAPVAPSVAKTEPVDDLALLADMVEQRRPIEVELAAKRKGNTGT